MQNDVLLLSLLVGLCAVYWAAVRGQDAEDEGLYGRSPYEWRTYDNFDEVDDMMNSVNAHNCHAKPAEQLRLPRETLAQLPRFNKLLSTLIYPNRTDLLHLHNMALNRAFFYSYIYQKLNETEDFLLQPGLMYYYFSAAADVSANEYNVNGSGIFFDNQCAYPNWYNNLKFNTTIPLFGPRAWRFDDYNDPTNWLREPTNNTIDIIDYGSGAQSNYTHKSYKINEFYTLWMPHEEGVNEPHSYDVGIKYSNETGKFVKDEFESETIFGPPSPGQQEKKLLPVKFTRPYFDCGKSNKWIVSAVAPVVDRLPRYLDWFHLRRFQFVASSVMDMDFLAIDINQCPIGIGNEAPNYFAGTAKCKDTTMCEPLYRGYGFRRGGYRCMCKPGYRYPRWQRGPFMGIDIESATEEEYKNGFDCIPVGLRQVIPIIRGNETMGTPDYERTDVIGKKRKKRSVGQPKVSQDLVQVQIKQKVLQSKEIIQVVDPRAKSRVLSKKKKFLRITGAKKAQHTKQSPKGLKKKPLFVPRYKRSTRHIRHKREAFNQEAYDRMDQIIKHKQGLTRHNCLKFMPEELELPGDVAYGVKEQFSYQARTALRLSHFLSNFLQNIDKYEDYGNLRGDSLLNIDLIFGEALANVMGDLKIKGSGVFFDIDKFEGPNYELRQFFGPYAYQFEDDKETGTTGNAADTASIHYQAVDFAGFPNHYLDKPWFKNVKERWQSNTYGLTKFTEKPMIRSDVKGTSLKKFELYPMYYFAPKEEDGWWSAPYFDCNGFVNDWIVTYSIPFFGLNSIRTDIEFKGVVIVDVKLDELNIQQCPHSFHVPNAFKDTARCDFETTYCEFLPSRKFTKGNYKCECKQGYEYPFNDRAWYFDGQTMEEEYRKMVEGEATRFHTLKCRIAGASQAMLSFLCLGLVFVVQLVHTIL